MVSSKFLVVKKNEFAVRRPLSLAIEFMYGSRS